MQWLKFLKCQAGFSLLEILVALFILSLALLGIAGFEITGLHNTQEAYWNSIATVQVNAMIERLRANQTLLARQNECEQWNLINQHLLPNALGNCICKINLCEVKLKWQGYRTSQLSISALV